MNFDGTDQQDATPPETTQAGFAALIGAPNAGKSTLMNAMVGQKVSIVTPKVQTTRSRIRGIAMHEAAQIIFIDTPGIFTAKRRLDRAMVNAAWQGAEDADVVLLMHDCARREPDEDTLKIIEKLAESGRSPSLVLNKIDLVQPERLLSRVSEISALYDFEKIFMVSAQTGNGIVDLRGWLASKMPTSPYLFDPDDLSDMPIRLLAAEILREKLFLNLHQELPYQLTVETDSWEEREDGSAEVHLSILLPARDIAPSYWARVDSQSDALAPLRARELEAALDRRVHLFSHVKYRKHWMNDSARYSIWDLDYDA